MQQPDPHTAQLVDKAVTALRIYWRQAATGENADLELALAESLIRELQTYERQYGGLGLPYDPNLLR